MIALSTLPRLRFALDELATDNGLSLHPNVGLLDNWEHKARTAEAELAGFSDEDIATLAAGDEDERADLATAAPNAADILACAIEGTLGASVFAAD